MTGKDADLIVSSRDHELSSPAARRWRCARRAVLRMLLGVLAFLTTASARGEQVQLPTPNIHAPVAIHAESAQRWRQGTYDVWLLRGNCAITQGRSTARSQEAVVWVEAGDPARNTPTKIIAYLEHGVSCQFYGDSGDEPLVNLADQRWFGRFLTLSPVQMNVPRQQGEPAEKPPIYQRGLAQLDPQAAAVQPAQFVEEPLDPPVADPIPIGTRRIRVFPRSDVPVQAQWFPSPGGQQWVAVITSGVNLIVDGIDLVGTLDASADRIVIWTSGIQPDLSGQALQPENVPLEIYLEGNIVFRQGERVIYAQRLYYDVRSQTGIILDAEMLTPVPNYAGMLRFKARVLRQLDASHFVGNDALATSSRLGAPRYNLASGEIFLEDQQVPVIDPATGAPRIDPLTGAPVLEQERMLYSSDNLLYVAGIPVFYWPTMATNLEDPAYYINSFSIKNDNLFGTQVQLGLDAYQLLGVREPPEGTDWKFDLDYLSKRGPGAGTVFAYESLDFLGAPGPASGVIDAWGIYDTGEDNLGGFREHLEPPNNWRGRVRALHRQELPNNYTLTAELGLISDRNFLEQYFEREWDSFKDEDTAIQLEQIIDNRSWSVRVEGRPNDFFTETEWLPLLEHNWLGESLLGNRLTWFEHSEAAYARVRQAELPTDPRQAALTEPLPWYADVEGPRIYTRQELDLPLNAGPAKFVPYALGELAHWGEAEDGDDAQRAYVQAGARASLPFWNVNPYVENQLLDLHGLAHKVVFEAEASWSESSIPLDELVLYDELDDNNVQEFRRNFFFTTYDLMPGDMYPARFDPRFYALRAGLGGRVTSSAMEIADDLTAVRLGMRNRWQTKRGHPAARNIIDWIVFDTNFVIFPDADQNFGENVGLLDYDFRWYIGDRFTLLSSGIFDVYPDGFKEVSVGGFLTRPPRGNLYMGVRTLQGPIDSTILALSYNYQMSPKWISSFGTSFDLGETGNIGQNFWLTRIGESLLFRLGFNVDANKEVFGVNFLIEPRFFPVTRTGTALGAQIPPAGAFGLE